MLANSAQKYPSRSSNSAISARFFSSRRCGPWRDIILRQFAPRGTGRNQRRREFEIGFQHQNPLITKHQWGAVANTSLEEQFRLRSIDTAR
jgi:hypothetical protein